MLCFFFKTHQMHIVGNKYLIIRMPQTVFLCAAQHFHISEGGSTSWRCFHTPQVCPHTTGLSMCLLVCPHPENMSTSHRRISILKMWPCVCRCVPIPAGVSTSACLFGCALVLMTSCWSLMDIVLWCSCVNHLKPATIRLSVVVEWFGSSWWQH